MAIRRTGAREEDGLEVPTKRFRVFGGAGEGSAGGILDAELELEA